jgi:hypothetical protein
VCRGFVEIWYSWIDIAPLSDNCRAGCNPVSAHNDYGPVADILIVNIQYIQGPGILNGMQKPWTIFLVGG